MSCQSIYRASTAPPKAMIPITSPYSGSTSAATSGHPRSPPQLAECGGDANRFHLMRALQMVKAFVPLGAKVGEDRRQMLSQPLIPGMGQAPVAVVDRPFEASVSLGADPVTRNGRAERGYAGRSIGHP